MHVQDVEYVIRPPIRPSDVPRCLRARLRARRPLDHVLAATRQHMVLMKNAASSEGVMKKKCGHPWRWRGRLPVFFLAHHMLAVRSRSQWTLGGLVLLAYAQSRRT